MPKTTEQKFTCNVNYQFDISLEDLRDLFCTMGQGSSYWATDVTVGNIETEEDEEELLMLNQVKIMNVRAVVYGSKT